MMIEKAYAKLKGSYQNIDGGVDRYAMVELTGGVCVQVCTGTLYVTSQLNAHIFATVAFL